MGSVGWIRVVLVSTVAFVACDPGGYFVISNPCSVEVQAAVFLDRESVPSLTSYRKLVAVPPGGSATDADLGRTGETIALVIREGRSQRVFELPYDEEVTIPQEACDGEAAGRP